MKIDVGHHRLGPLSDGNRTQLSACWQDRCGGCYSPLLRGMLRGMSEVGGSGDRAQELKAQVARRAREVRAQAIARAPQVTGAAAQQAQRVVQDRPGAAVGAALAVLGLLIVGRRQRRRKKAKKAQQVRGRSRARRAQRWTRALAVLALLMRRRRRRQEEDS